MPDYTLYDAILQAIENAETEDVTDDDMLPVEHYLPELQWKS